MNNPANPASDPAQPPKADAAASQEANGPKAAQPKAAKPNGPKGALRIKPVAMPAIMHKRHRGIIYSFGIVVLLPVFLAFIYLWLVADDRYASQTGFTVRTEDSQGASELLGGIAGLSGVSTTSDASVLYEFIRSPQIIEAIDKQLDLRSHYSAHFASDPLFSLHPDATIEDLTAYWNRVVQVSYDKSSGLIEVEVTGFEPDYAQQVAQAIVDQSQNLVNELSRAARADSLNYAQQDLQTAQARLRSAREALTAFRTRTQIVDIDSDIQGRTGVLTSLQQQLAQELVAYDELLGTTRDDDPRVAQTRRRIEVIRNRISKERSNFAGSKVDGTDQDYPSLMAEYEGLNVEREFAESAYTAALTALDSARAEASRQSRYLAIYIKPTKAQSAEYPKRMQLLGLTALFLILAWGIAVLIVYSVRDRN